MPHARSRGVLLALLGVTVAAGLASRAVPEWQPALVARYAGDTLWAAMVFWLLALLRPAAGTAGLGLAALAVATLVELSQLYHAPALDALRTTRLGALVLGQGFLWSDLACYAIGVALAALVDRRLPRGRP